MSEGDAQPGERKYLLSDFKRNEETTTLPPQAAAAPSERKYLLSDFARKDDAAAVDPSRAQAVPVAPATQAATVAPTAARTVAIAPPAAVPAFAAGAVAAAIARGLRPSFDDVRGHPVAAAAAAGDGEAEGETRRVVLPDGRVSQLRIEKPRAAVDVRATAARARSRRWLASGAGGAANGGGGLSWTGSGARLDPAARVAALAGARLPLRQSGVAWPAEGAENGRAWRGEEKSSGGGGTAGVPRRATDAWPALGASAGVLPGRFVTHANNKDTGGRAAIRALVALPGGELIATASASGMIAVWRATSLAFRCLATDAAPPPHGAPRRASTRTGANRGRRDPTDGGRRDAADGERRDATDVPKLVDWGRGLPPGAQRGAGLGRGHSGELVALQLAPPTSLLGAPRVLGSLDAGGTLRIWTTEFESCGGLLTGVAIAASSSSSSSSSPSSSAVAGVGVGVGVGVGWEEEEEALTSAEGAAETLALGAGAATAAGTCADGAVRLWDVERGALVCTWTADAAFGGERARALDWCPASGLVAVGGAFGSIRLLDTRAGAAAAVYSLAAGASSFFPAASSPATTQGLAALPDRAGGPTAFRGERKKKGPTAFQAGSAQVQAQAHAGCVAELRWRGDGCLLLSSGRADGQVRLWDARRAGGRPGPGPLLRAYEDARECAGAGAARPTALAWCPADSDQFAAGFQDGSVAFWSAARAERQAQLAWSHRGAVRAATWACDGSAFYTGGDIFAAAWARPRLGGANDDGGGGGGYGGGKGLEPRYAVFAADDLETRRAGLERLARADPDLADDLLVAAARARLAAATAPLLRAPGTTPPPLRPRPADPYLAALFEEELAHWDTASAAATLPGTTPSRGVPPTTDAAAAAAAATTSETEATASAGAAGVWSGA